FVFAIFVPLLWWSIGRMADVEYGLGRAQGRVRPPLRARTITLSYGISIIASLRAFLQPATFWPVLALVTPAVDSYERSELASKMPAATLIPGGQFPPLLVPTPSSPPALFSPRRANIRGVRASAHPGSPTPPGWHDSPGRPTGRSSACMPTGLRF